MIVRLTSAKGTVAQEVEVSITRDFRNLEHPEGWRGEAWLPMDAVIMPGERLRLELPDGQSAEILIERVTVDTKDQRMLARFTGWGELDLPKEENPPREA